MCEVQTPDLSNFLKKMDTLCVEVQSLGESQIPVITLVIPSFTQSLPLSPSMRFDLFVEKDMISTIKPNKGREAEL